jgi:hypothetical protein
MHARPAPSDHRPPDRAPPARTGYTSPLNFDNSGEQRAAMGRAEVPHLRQRGPGHTGDIEATWNKKDEQQSRPSGTRAP